MGTWKHTDGTISDTYTDSAKFVPDKGWEYGDNYSNATLERVVTGEDGEPLVAFRAKLERDEYADAPDYGYDMGCPVYAYEHRYGVTIEETPRMGADSDAHSGVDFRAALMYFYETATFSDAIAITDRWLRIFHGGSLAEIESTVHRSSYSYLVYDTRKMREFWGQEGERLETSDPEGDEWQAFIDGEVYFAEIERTFAFDEEGDPDWDEVESVDGPVGGHYGEDFAKQSAEDMLAYEVEHFDVAAHVAKGLADQRAESQRISITVDRSFDGDTLVVLPPGTEIPGVQHDDGISAVALIDFARWIVAEYEDAEREDARWIGDGGPADTERGKHEIGEGE